MPLLVALALAFAAGVGFAVVLFRQIVRRHFVPALLAAKSIADRAEEATAEAAFHQAQAHRMMKLAREARGVYERALHAVYTAQPMGLPDGFVRTHPHLANRFHAAVTILNDPRPLAPADLWPDAEGSAADVKTPDKTR